MNKKFSFGSFCFFFPLGVGSGVGKSESGTSPTVYDCYELVCFGFPVFSPVRLAIKIES